MVPKKPFICHRWYTPRFLLGGGHLVGRQQVLSLAFFRAQLSINSDRRMVKLNFASLDFLQDLFGNAPPMT